jgi:hypothetical protein
MKILKNSSILNSNSQGKWMEADLICNQVINLSLWLTTILTSVRANNPWWVLYKKGTIGMDKQIWYKIWKSKWVQQLWLKLMLPAHLESNKKQIAVLMLANNLIISELIQRVWTSKIHMMLLQDQKVNLLKWVAEDLNNHLQ